MAQATKAASELKKLREENRKLQAENKMLNQSVKQKQRGMGPRLWRKLAIIICVSLAGALLVSGNALFWMGNSLLDNQRYNQTVAPLITEPAVQSTIASYATNQLYKNVNIEQLTTNVLPPRADFLAPALSSQIKGATHTALLKALQNPSFQQTWNRTQQTAHDRLIKFIKNYQGDGTIDLSDIYKQLSSNLAQTKLGFLANKTLPDKVGSITIIDASWLPVAHNLAVNIGLYQTLATLLVIGLTALAIYLADNRRRMAISLSILFSGLMLCTLIALKVIQGGLVMHVGAEYKEVTRVVADRAFYSLVIQTRTILLVSALLGIVAWVSGPYKLAISTRERFNQLLAGKLHQAIIGKHDNAFTVWLGTHKRVIQWILIALVAGLMLAVQLTPVSVFWYGLLMVLLVAIVELLAAPVKT